MNVFAMQSKYMTTVKVLEIIGGVLLLFPKTRAIGICIIVPIVVNILLFEIFIAKSVSIGAALVVLSILAIYFNKEKFASMLK
jgi:putative oxidoreductase